MTRSILRIDASARVDGSITRDLTDRLVARFTRNGPVALTTRDLASGLPQLTEAWIGANFTPAENRTEAQQRTLALSDKLIDEVAAADTLVIGLPIYNFGVPAVLKSWLDHIARAGVTFRYNATGPEGLLTGKRAIVAVASGGTEVGSDLDFATGYLRHVLAFIGITEVEFIAADRAAMDPEGTVRAAEAAVDALPLAA